MPTFSSEASRPIARRLFVYGSLTDPRRLDEVLGRRHRGERFAARLAGFERIVDRYAYPYLVARPGAQVDGVLLLDLTSADLARLDRYEEVADGIYRRELVEVEAFGCGSRPARVRAYVYVAGPRLAHLTR